MECYDSRIDVWILCVFFFVGIFFVVYEVVVCRGDIYVIGGYFFYRLFRYSFVKDSWNECFYSVSYRRFSDMVAFGGFLYRFDLLRGVGVVVMRYNIVIGFWS